MSLQYRLDGFRAVFESGYRPDSVPRPIIEIMEKATEELIASRAADHALRKDNIAPLFVLNDARGSPVSSSDLLRHGPLILTFYRGVWCPYCNLELQALQSALPNFRERGASLVSISPQTAPNSRASQENNRLTYPILSDPQNAVADKFGVKFQLPGYLIEVYKTLKNDLPLFNGDPSWTLPMPSRFVIRQDGMIAYAEVNPDYRVRPEPEELLPILDAIAVSRA